MINRHVFAVAAFLLMIGFMTPTVPARAATGSMQFIGSLGDRALQVVRSNAAPAQIDGVSMAASQRESLAQQIRASGGQIDVFLARMQEEDRGLVGSL